MRPGAPKMPKRLSDASWDRFGKQNGAPDVHFPSLRGCSIDVFVQCIARSMYRFAGAMDLTRVANMSLHRAMRVLEDSSCDLISKTHG